MKWLQPYAYFGLPKLLQLNNGREFVNSVIDNLVRTVAWRGDYDHWTSTTSSEPVKDLPSVAMLRWKRCLFVAFPQPAMRIVRLPRLHTVQSTMKATPYELVFWQPPWTTLFPSVSGHVMEEARLPSNHLRLPSHHPRLPNCCQWFLLMAVISLHASPTQWWVKKLQLRISDKKTLGDRH